MCSIIFILDFVGQDRFRTKKMRKIHRFRMDHFQEELGAAVGHTHSRQEKVADSIL